MIERRNRRCGASRVAISALLGFAVAASCIVVARGEPYEEWRARVSAKLLAVYDAAARGEAPAPSGASSAAAPPATVSPFSPHIDAMGRVQVDVHYDCSSNAPVAALASAGLSVGASVHVPPLCVVEGWIAPAGLASLASVAGVTHVAMPTYALHPRAPSGTLPAPTGHSAPRGSEGEPPLSRLQSPPGSAIDGNGVAILHADQFVAQTGTRGAGVTVGVQSTGVTSLSVIQQRGELPSVQVLAPSGQSTPPVGDEGTVLLEEVHAVAPGAGLAFCGPDTFVEYSSCLQQLIAAGATVLADDVIFLGQDLLSAANPDTQAVESILTSHPAVALFTVVGNYNGSYWEGAYAPVSLASQSQSPLTCPAAGGTQTDAYIAEFGSSPSQQLTVKQAGQFPVLFAWGDPSDANASRFDVYWSNNADPTQNGCFSTAGVNGNVITPNLSLAGGTYTLTIATPDASPGGKFLKLWIGGDGLTFLSVPTSGAIVSAQAFAQGAITIGAVNGSDGIGNQIENFSSLGPLTLLFPAPTQVQAPTLVAPDGIYVDASGTYFEGMLFPDGNFYGTSASVPNAAAVAALLRGAFPTATVPQLVKALTAGSAQLGTRVPDDTFGYGRIDAMGALAALQEMGYTVTPPTPSSVAAPPVAATPSGTTGGGSGGGGGGAFGWAEMAVLALLTAMRVLQRPPALARGRPPGPSQ